MSEFFILITFKRLNISQNKHHEITKTLSLFEISSLKLWIRKF